MAITVEELQGLYNQGDYRGVIEEYLKWREELTVRNPDAPVDSWDLIAAWAHYQLHELDSAKPLAMLVTTRFPETSEEGDSALRLWAHCAERQGDLDAAEHLLERLLPGSARDNLWLTTLIARHRKGQTINTELVIRLVTEAILRIPSQVVDGHIINNATWLLHEAREQEGVRPFLSRLPGFIEIAIGIYKETGAAKNHQTGVLFRAASIFSEVPDLQRPALGIIDQCIAQWTELVALQGGDRYVQNLKGAQELREQILARLGS